MASRKRETDLSTGRDRPGRDDVREHVLVLVLLLESRYSVLLIAQRRRQGVRTRVASPGGRAEAGSRAKARRKNVRPWFLKLSLCIDLGRDL